MFFVMAVIEVTTHAPNIIYRLLLFHLAQGFSWRTLRLVGVEEDRRV